MSNIQGKVVIITGASSGSEKRLQKNSLLEARRWFLQLVVEETARRYSKQRRSSHLRSDRCDFDEQMEELAESALKAFGKIDVLVNNAGNMPHSFLYKRQVDDWNRMIDVNIKGVLYGIAAVLPSMRERKEGHIINVSSVAGHVVGAGSTVYAGTKFAVRAISEGLRKEELGNNIRSTIISPGAVATELTNSVTDPDLKPSIDEIYKSAIDADSIARAIAFAIEQPSDVAMNEMMIRPTGQER